MGSAAVLEECKHIRGSELARGCSLALTGSGTYTEWAAPGALYGHMCSTGSTKDVNEESPCDTSNKV